ncbi:MAG: IS200/IS605 family transposase [Candidatus Hodarchaeales archaeon]|jgi:putative transposase
MKIRRFSRKSSAVCDINYHLIFVTKYRKHVLNGEVVDYLERVLHDIATKRKLEIILISISPDHVHLFIGSDPLQPPYDIIKSFKGITSFKLFKQFPALQVHLWNGRLWSPSYWVSTAGSISAETVKKYIENQETEDIARKS